MVPEQNCKYLNPNEHTKGMFRRLFWHGKSVADPTPNPRQKSAPSAWILNADFAMVLDADLPHFNGANPLLSCQTRIPLENFASSILTRGITIQLNGGGMQVLIGVEMDADLARNPHPIRIKKTLWEPAYVMQCSVFAMVWLQRGKLPMVPEQSSLRFTYDSFCNGFISVPLNPCVFLARLFWSALSLFLPPGIQSRAQTIFVVHS